MQSLAEVQKAIAIYNFVLVGKLLSGDEKKAWCFVVYALQFGINRIIKIIEIIDNQNNQHICNNYNRTDCVQIGSGNNVILNHRLCARTKGVEESNLQCSTQALRLPFPLTHVAP